MRSGALKFRTPAVHADEVGGVYCCIRERAAHPRVNEPAAAACVITLTMTVASIHGVGRNFQDIPSSSEIQNTWQRSSAVRSMAAGRLTARHLDGPLSPARFRVTRER